ncbi:MAG: hypothetical protein BWY64_03472 [bacterium ADurb.Bin363]|nr:MAG: hypothetical protein BWY64_03472 [bacterium ADurb.Bin363]
MQLNFTVMAKIVKTIDTEPLKSQMERANKRMKEAQKQRNNWWKKLPRKRRRVKV